MRASHAKLIVLALCGTIVIMVFLTRFQRALIFHPRAAPTDLTIAERVPGLERWWHDSPEGPVEAFFVPGAGVSADAPGPVVVYAHGNAEVIDPLPLWLEPYRVMGVSVLLPEYRGYGRSAGTPTERAIREDLVAFYDRLIARPDVDPARIAYHGVSLGGGAVSQLARERPPAAIILQSTFTSVADLAWEGFRAPRFLLSDPFDSIAVLRDLGRPTLLFHGRRDEVVPFTHGERLHEAIAGSVLVRCTAGHNDLPSPEIDFWSEIESFLRASGVLGGAAHAAGVSRK
ncbi:MAG: alpha/beta hydrolase [Myxococcota bacterium]|nr:alpha/beta hydrolase [Myxococcota bacterium]